MAAASLGSATNSRVDSAAKHTMACKLDGAFLKRTLENPTENGEERLNQGKLKYAMLKDELAMNTTKRFFGTSGHAAYPLVVTTVGDIDDETKNFLKMIYSSATATDFLLSTSVKNKDTYGKDHASDSKVYKNVTNNLPEFRVQGIALGQAFASHLSGDTVATVLVGGMATVMNGAFEVFAGDEIQWYFDFEQDMYYLESNSDYRQGQRRTEQGNDRMPMHIAKKMRYNDARLMGSQPGLGNTKGFKNSQSIFRIKSYQPFIVDIAGTKIATTHYGDKIRVFAKAMSSARPFDMVDILLCTQST